MSNQIQFSVTYDPPLTAPFVRTRLFRDLAVEIADARRRKQNFTIKLINGVSKENKVLSAETIDILMRQQLQSNRFGALPTTQKRFVHPWRRVVMQNLLAKHFSIIEWSNIAHACDWSRSFLLTESVKSSDYQVPAICFDIDDTLIDTDDKPIAETVKLYRSVKPAQRVIVTARSPNYRQFTDKQLADLGPYFSLNHMSRSYLHNNAIHKYKLRQREISRDIDCRDIVINIGDQWTDLFGNPEFLQQADINLDSTNIYGFFPKTPEARAAAAARVAVKLPSRS